RRKAGLVLPTAAATTGAPIRRDYHLAPRPQERELGGLDNRAVELAHPLQLQPAHIRLPLPQYVASISPWALTRKSGFTPNFPRQLDNKTELSFLHLRRHGIASVNAGEAALRAYRQPVKRHVPARLVHTRA